MTDTPNYGEIADRLEANNLWPFKDIEPIMLLLGYEAKPHGRLGMACRRPGEHHWQSVPDFRSADSFETWVLSDERVKLNDIGREDDGRFYVSLDAPEYGNDYGYSSRLGSAMWAAFVKLYGRVDNEEE